MSDIAETLAAREALYGNFQEQAAIACKIKDAMREGKSWPLLAPDQREALDMMAVKQARILSGDPNCFDSWHDLEGYLRLVANRLKP